jgi:hypothetical protein
MTQSIADQLGNAIGQMRYEIEELIDGNDFETCLSRIEDCAREIIKLTELSK